MKKHYALTLLIACSSAATANGFDGFYIGGGIGATGYDDGGMYKNSVYKFKSKEDGNSYKIIAGYQFNRIVAIEAQYTIYGDVKNTSQSISAANSTLEHKSAVVSANLGYTFDNGFRPFGTLGLGSMTIDEKNHSDSGTAVRAGFGIEYTPKSLQGLSFRAAYEGDAFTVEDNSTSKKKEYDQAIGTFYLGSSYKF